MMSPRLFIFGFCALLLPKAAWAQLTMFEKNGFSENRIDLAILAEGYTETEQAQFQSDAADLAETVFSKSPFTEYRGLFNVGFVFTPSNDSGVDTSPDEDLVDSALKCFFGCGGLDGLLCCYGDVLTTASREYPEWDYILVLVNSEHYGASGGTFAIVSSASRFSKTTVHEMGHSLGGLADEYDGEYTIECHENYPNITQNADRKTLKWRDWVADETPIPTTEYVSDLEPVGAYQGGCYSETDYYRPVWSCLMQSLGNDFCPVCAEQLVKSFYGTVEPVDGWVPDSSIVSGEAGDVQEFVVETARVTTIQVKWLIDNKSVNNWDGRTSISLPFDCLSTGAHVLEAVAYDDTGLVRNDPEGLLYQSLSWTIERTDVGPVEGKCGDDNLQDGGSAVDSGADTASEADTDSIDSGIFSPSSGDGCGCMLVGEPSFYPRGMLQDLFLLLFS